jgi:cysteinyl-tRNA synthetase
VYFDVKKYAASHDYGKLSGRVLDDLLTTTRELEGQEDKRDRADFALWKEAPPEHIMRWKSPWGEGFPGWHIECSAMSSKYLGKQFDIHGGGMDLQFPHHESEIAQSTICNHEMPARYWIHNNMITVNGKKMGKSYNNQIKLTEMFSGSHPILEQAYTPMTIRFFILQTHYHSTLNFSNEALQAAERGLRRLMDAYGVLKKLDPRSLPSSEQTPPIEINSQTADDEDTNAKVLRLLQEFDDNMNDDFNTAKVLAAMFEIVPVINSLKDGALAPGSISADTLQQLQKGMQVYLEDILGLVDERRTEEEKLNGLMEVLIDIRKDARAKRDWATSDKIRNQLTAHGIVLKDEKDGSMSWSMK